MTFPKTAPDHHPICTAPPSTLAAPRRRQRRLYDYDDDGGGGFCVLWIIYYLFTLGTYFICVNARELYARKCTHARIWMCVYRLLRTRWRWRRGLKRTTTTGERESHDGGGRAYLWPRCCLVGGGCRDKIIISCVRRRRLMLQWICLIAYAHYWIRKEKPREKR